MSSAWEDQTEVNIREWAGRRKQKPVRSPESRSKRIPGLFGIEARPERPRGLGGRYRLLICPKVSRLQNEKTATFRTMGVAVSSVYKQRLDGGVLEGDWWPGLPILGWNTLEPSNHALEQRAAITHQPEQIPWEIETTVQQV